jgi:CRP/FNR family transcriptional regulator, transcriptional activator FtrB
MEVIPSVGSSLGVSTPSWDISDIPLFASLGEASRRRLLGAARTERVPASATLFQAGEHATDLHILLRGMIDIACTYRGKHCTAMLMTSGDVLMLGSPLYSEPYLVSAQTLTPCRIMKINADLVRDEASRTPELAFAIARLLAGHWRIALRIILDLKCRSPSQRLAAFLLRLHDSCSPGSVAQIPIAKRQLAARVGMQPETLSRTLQVLGQNGLRVRGRQIIVTDRAKAEAFCGPDPYPGSREDELGVHAL